MPLPCHFMAWAISHKAFYAYFMLFIALDSTRKAFYAYFMPFYGMSY